MGTMRKCTQASVKSPETRNSGQVADGAADGAAKEQDADLSHPFFSKLKSTAGGGLSPRSKRLAEMNKENDGAG